MRNHLRNLPTVATAAAILSLALAAWSPAQAQEQQSSPRPSRREAGRLPQESPGESTRPTEAAAAPSVQRPNAPPTHVTPQPAEVMPAVLPPDTQASPTEITVNGVHIVGVPDDWSFHHAMFSNPGTEEDAIAKGKHDDWLRIVNEPRYVIQQLRRLAPVQGPYAEQVAALEASPPGLETGQATQVPEPDKRHKMKMKKDWNLTLGSGGTTQEPYGQIYPAKWSFSTTTANCTNDFVIYPTAAAGSGSQATIIAYNELYGTSGPPGTGCGAGGGTVPSPYWAYNTASGGTGVKVNSSPIFSSNGSQIAFIQNNSSSVASLVLLKWAQSSSNSLTSPDTLTAQTSASAYTTCMAPCMWVATLSGSPFVFLSQPFYDYTSDTLWVGDNVGKIHTFHPVFNGALTELTAVSMQTTASLSAPVYDPVSGCVFVSSVTAYEYWVDSGVTASTCTGCTTGSYCTSTTPALVTYVTGKTSCDGFVDGPVMDSTAGVNYQSQQDYNSSSCVSGSSYCDVLWQCSNNPSATCPGCTSGDVCTGNFIGAGARQAGSADCNESAGPYAGAFDNIYLGSATHTGNFYVVGSFYYNPPATLYQAHIASNVLSTFTAGPLLQENTTGSSLGGTFGSASPVTEFYNSATGVDSIFVAAYNGKPTGCSGTSSPSSAPTTACVMAYNVNSGSISTSSTPTGELVINSGYYWSPTTGFIIDNSVGSGTEAGASEIYFMGTDASLTYCVGSSGQAGLCGFQASQLP